ncbi:NADP-dependent oxidoreductase [Christiangramia forsetii]|uniref:Zinc-type alcohol dehydrogenase n=2 Tax=Christiangramia forsetii TaxID=411153 RepID=A0M2P9_CHRFK|nr:NADP-dependent oxidoreductase [Christiangramia forsetii]GGG44277.1 NADPH:quinone reductase [Christiangramia forsetii]CAL66894.1 zinc-type alcohol dehydrogenase [Christiangramia forsetii KT0803]
MKALQITKYGDFKDSLQFNEVDKPEISENEILIAVKAVSLNPIDYKIVEGNLKEMLKLDFPATVGYDVSGEVVEIGSAVKNFKIGDAVFGRVPQEYMGTLAEFVAVDSAVMAHKPEEISFEKASSLPLVGLTAIQALEKAGLKKDDRVLIHAGSGGVGSFAIQYAKAKGAIVYTTTSKTNMDWVKALGADRVIDYKNEDYKEVSNNLDIVFDTLGDDYTFEAFDIIEKGGSVTSIVGPPDPETAKQMGMEDYQMPEILSELIKEKSANYTLTWMQPNAEQLKEIKTMVEDRTIRPVIDLIYSFQDAVKAFEYLADGHAQGKVIVNLAETFENNK